MKQRPIIFNTEMVQAILEGQKTQTRRIIKPQPSFHPDTGNWQFGKHMSMFTMYPERDVVWPDDCRYQSGDLLYVREIWAKIDGSAFGGGWVNYIYKADDPSTTTNENLDIWRCKWQAAIHMPKAASRIWLEVKNVKVERLQDISKDDAIAEGVESWIEERMKSKPVHYRMYCDFDSPTDPSFFTTCPIDSFESLWRKIHGPEAWNENPWVWVIEFERKNVPA